MDEVVEGEGIESSPHPEEPHQEAMVVDDGSSASIQQGGEIAASTLENRKFISCIIDRPNV